MKLAALASLVPIAGCSLALDSARFAACPADDPACLDGGPPRDGSAPGADAEHDRALAWYRMDDDPVTVRDEYGEFHGTCARCPAPGEGLVDGGYQFDGESVVLLPPGSALGTLIGSATLWFRPSALPNGADAAVLIGKPCDECLVDWSLAILANGQLLFRLGPTLVQTEGEPPAVVDRWTHVAVVWARDDQVEMFVDGALRGSSPRWFPEPPPGRGFIGAGLLPERDGVIEDAFRGVLDDVRSFQVALSADEIAALAAPP